MPKKKRERGYIPTGKGGGVVCGFHPGADQSDGICEECLLLDDKKEEAMTHPPRNSATKKKRFQVTVVMRSIETWTVEAENEEDARENYGRGNLDSDEPEESRVTTVIEEPEGVRHV